MSTSEAYIETPRYDALAVELRPIVADFDETFAATRAIHEHTRSELPEHLKTDDFSFVEAYALKSATSLMVFSDTEHNIAARVISNGSESGLGNPTWNYVIANGRSYVFTATVEVFAELVDETARQVAVAVQRSSQSLEDLSLSANSAIERIAQSRDTELRAAAAFMVGKASIDTSTDNVVSFTVDEGYVAPDELLDKLQAGREEEVIREHDQVMLVTETAYFPSFSPLKLIAPKYVRNALVTATNLPN